MPNVMNQRQRFHQINIQSKLCGNGTRNLRNFQRMRQAIAEMVGIAAGENLGLGFQPAERARMNYPVAVALKVVAVRMLRLRMTPPTRVLHANSVRSQRKAISHQESRCASMVAKGRLGQPPMKSVYLTAESYYCPSFASLTFAVSSFFCARASASWSTSGDTVLFHSSTARSQCEAASFRRPVFW